MADLELFLAQMLAASGRGSWCGPMLYCGSRPARRPRTARRTRPAGEMLRWSWRLGGPPAAATLAAAVPRAAGVRDGAMARLEAVLFLSREPLGSRKLAQLASLADGTQARTLVRCLNRLYDEGGSAFRIEEIAGGFQLFTRPQLAPWVRRLHRVSARSRLSPPALETLAVVAYRQPAPRAEVEAVRGVQCGEILSQLMERDLVRIVGRSAELGRPFLYGTTRRFLQQFGLRRLDDLPRPELRRTPASGTVSDTSAGRSRMDHTNHFHDREEESL